MPDQQKDYPTALRVGKLLCSMGPSILNRAVRSDTPMTSDTSKVTESAVLKADIHLVSDAFHRGRAVENG
jgi:hypothetical protein